MKKMVAFGMAIAMVFAMFSMTGCGTTTYDFDPYSGNNPDSTVKFVYDEDGNLV